MSFETNHFWVLSADESMESTWQVKWERPNHPTGWVFTADNDKKNHHLTSSEILDFLAVQGIPTEKLHKAIVESVLTMACFSDTFLKQSRRLLGDDVVDEGIESYDQFAKSLQSLIEEQITKPTPQPKLRIMKSEP